MYTNMCRACGYSWEDSKIGESCPKCKAGKDRIGFAYTETKTETEKPKELKTETKFNLSSSAGS